jgi:DNA-binding Xre family transcriptional regulator
MDFVLSHPQTMSKHSLRAIVASTVRTAMEVRPEISTQQKLAQRAGVAQSHISRLLKGENVTLDVLEKVARALKVEPFELIIDNDRARLSLLARIFGKDAPSDAETERLLKLRPKDAGDAKPTS